MGKNQIIPIYFTNGSIMQNIDYSRRLKTREIPNPKPITSHQLATFAGHTLSRSPKSPSFLFIMVGAILLFTSGLVIGLKMDQKENNFAQNETKETHSFKNISSQEPSQIEEIGEKAAKAIEPPTKLVKEKRKKETPQPRGLKYPPKTGELNYMIQLGNFPPEKSLPIGNKLIQTKPELQGRLFRTTSGKLYLGYFYSEEEAKKVLSKVKSQSGGIFQGATIKTLEY